MKHLLLICPNCRNKIESHQKLEPIGDRFIHVYSCDKYAILFEEDTVFPHGYELIYEYEKRIKEKSYNFDNIIFILNFDFEVFTTTPRSCINNNYNFEYNYNISGYSEFLMNNYNLSSHNYGLVSGFRFPFKFIKRAEKVLSEQEKFDFCFNFAKKYLKEYELHKIFK